jgi:hypothetical protein
MTSSFPLATRAKSARRSVIFTNRRVGGAASPRRPLRSYGVSLLMRVDQFALEPRVFPQSPNPFASRP